jgi:predicted XRE-type DNA-binding protein
MSKNKRYHEVSQMVRETSESQDFSEAFDKRLARRQLIKSLLLLRASQGLSQEDIANKIKCSQSRVSKLEASEDCDLRIGDVLNYGSALGLQMQVVCFKKGMVVADQVKYHFFQMKELMEKMVTLANDDPVIAKGVARFFTEASVNLFAMLVDSATSLPEAVHEDMPLIKVVNAHGQSEPDEPDDAADQSHVAKATNGKANHAVTA